MISFLLCLAILIVGYFVYLADKKHFRHVKIFPYIVSF